MWQSFPDLQLANTHSYANRIRRETVKNDSQSNLDLFFANCHFCQSRPDVSRDRFTAG